MISHPKMEELKMHIQCVMLWEFKNNKTLGYWPNESSIRQWSGRPKFNPRSSHTKNSKNST